MTPYDAAMAGVIVAGMVWGALRGITWQLASLASLVLGYSVSHMASGQLAPHFPGEPVVARALAMITVYFAVSGGVFLTAWMIRATLRRLKFEAFDRHLGMVLGGFEGALLGLVATLFVVSLAPQARDPIFNSPSGKLVGQVMAVLGPVLPEEARGVLTPFWSGTAVRPAPVADQQPAPEPRTTARPAPGEAGASRDTAASPASLSDLVEESERRIGQAVIEGATEGLKRAAKGRSVDGSDPAVERR
jgi:membrane protein required for colicin V production